MRKTNLQRLPVLASALAASPSVASSDPFGRETTLLLILSILLVLLGIAILVLRYSLRFSGAGNADAKQKKDEKEISAQVALAERILRAAKEQMKQEQAAAAKKASSLPVTKAITPAANRAKAKRTTQKRKPRRRTTVTVRGPKKTR